MHFLTLLDSAKSRMCHCVLVTVILIATKELETHLMSPSNSLISFHSAWGSQYPPYTSLVFPSHIKLCLISFTPLVLFEAYVHFKKSQNVQQNLCHIHLHLHSPFRPEQRWEPCLSFVPPLLPPPFQLPASLQPCSPPPPSELYCECLVQQPLLQYAALPFTQQAWAKRSTASRFWLRGGERKEREALQTADPDFWAHLWSVGIWMNADTYWFVCFKL